MDARTYAECLEKYQLAIGTADRYRSTLRQSKRKADKPWVIISDPHLPGLRTDLLGEILSEYKRYNCAVLGDVLNLDRCSRWDKTDHKEPDLETLFKERDAFVRTLRETFSQVKVLGGNHDARLWRTASKLGPDYYWVTQVFFEKMFADLHDVEFVWKPFVKRDGRTITTCFWDQIGDCVLGHVERSGSTPVRGGRLANEFFQQWRSELGLQWPYRVLLQAHTHKRGYWYDPVTHVHCFETGAMCDNPDYAVLSHRSSPVQHGYYLLYQTAGVTDLKKSRLVILEDS